MVEVRRIGQESETGRGEGEKVNCDGSEAVKMQAVVWCVWLDCRGCKSSKPVRTIV